MIYRGDVEYAENSGLTTEARPSALRLRLEERTRRGEIRMTKFEIRINDE
jgi:hypothetical protein